LEKVLMRIALLPDDYLPSSTLAHAKMFHDLALELRHQGHEVVVITPGNPSQTEKLYINYIDGIEVWWFRSGRTRKVGRLRRAINETLLSHRAWSAIKKEVNNRGFDLCVNYSPTIFFGSLVEKLKAANGNCFSYLILRDLFPQWVIDEGLIKEQSLIARYFQYFEMLNYRSSDVIGLMSDANVSYFNQLYPEITNTEVLRNWSATKPFKYEEYTLDIRAEYGLHEKVIFFYGGNIGRAQNMENILRLSKNIKHQKNAHFVLVGQGDEVPLVKKLQIEWGLTNLTVIDSVTQDVYKELLAQVDVGVFSLAKSHKAHNFPGKLLGYMLQSLPILGSANVGNDLVDMINKEQAGVALINGEDDKLLYAAEKMLSSKELRTSYGKQGYKALLKFFSVQSIAKQILDKANKGSL
jgi:glycosyltransferase involved in cell wall biosynthesis